MNARHEQLPPELEALKEAYRAQTAPASLQRRIVAAATEQRAPRRLWIPAVAGVAAAVVVGVFVMLQQSANMPAGANVSLSAVAAQVSQAEGELSRALSAGKPHSPSMTRLPSVRLSPSSPPLKHGKMRKKTDVTDNQNSDKLV